MWAAAPVEEVVVPPLAVPELAPLEVAVPEEPEREAEPEAEAEPLDLDAPELLAVVETTCTNVVELSAVTTTVLVGTVPLPPK